MIIVATIKMELTEAPEHVEEPEEQEPEEQEPEEQEPEEPKLVEQEVKVKKPRAKRVPKAKPLPVVAPPTDPPRADADFWRDMLLTKREMEKAETRARYSNLVILK